LASQEDYLEENIEVIYGAENIIDYGLKNCSRAKRQVDILSDSNGPSIFVIPGHPITMAFREFKPKGIKLRFIAEITKDNIPYCQQLMKICELRHLDEVKGNFGIVDGLYYSASAKGTDSSPPPLLIGSTIRAFVEQQQYFFDMLWRKAIPAKQRIKEIEEGLKREFIETIQDPDEILNLIPKIINSAIEELDIVISTADTFNRYEREGIIRLLIRKAEEGIKVRILLSQNYDIQQSIGKLRVYPQITIKNLDKSVQTKVTTIVADNGLSLVIELKDDTQLNSNEAMGLATYSNSESTVLSYASIFETLWIQSSGITI
jgi:two-component system, OmpR family, sensor histidine kinase VicK